MVPDERGGAGDGKGLSQHAPRTRSGAESTRARVQLFPHIARLPGAVKVANLNRCATTCVAMSCRHISWTATARRGKLTTRQYQIERDQTILIALDAGRLMTARIEQETKLDSAVHATLALFSAAGRAGDNAGLVVFGRRIKSYLPPGRGRDHIEAALEALHAVEPEMIEPSYPHAFEFIAANSKRRSLVVLLTDLVDEEGSKELLTSLHILRPRHLPLVVTIADRDLKAVVRKTPESVRDLFTQSVAEEIIHHREAALRWVESVGGLALDVTAAAFAPALLETYLRVKERGLL